MLLNQTNPMSSRVERLEWVLSRISDEVSRLQTGAVISHVDLDPFKVMADRALNESSTYSGDWKTDANAINGQEGCHFDLAQWVESKGFEVQADYDTAGEGSLSLILRPGFEDTDERIVGSIKGDSDAVVVITADLS